MSGAHVFIPASDIRNAMQCNAVLPVVMIEGIQQFGLRRAPVKLMSVHISWRQCPRTQETKMEDFRHPEKRHFRHWDRAAKGGQAT